MGFFNKIISSIFGHSTPVAAAVPVASAPASVSATVGADAPVAPAETAAPVPVVPPVVVDVDAVLSELAAKNPEKLDWKKSIVDLMKLLDIDSSLSARKELAAELHYPGDTSDSASMNIWLHKAVLKKLVENGGKVPAELLD